MEPWGHGMQLEFRLLGPLEIRMGEAGVVHVRAPKERALLAILLLHANEIVPNARLIDELWGDRPPESALNALQTYVSHLRRLLEPGRRQREGGFIVTRPRGYLLRLAAGQLDLDRFERLVAEARSLDPAAALETLRDALRLWRGSPLQDFALDEFARGEIARLEELRVSTIEDRIDLELQLGRKGELVAELEALVAAHPLRERLRGQLMLALYRAGRQVEALQAYQDARRLLIDELGIEPSSRLRELERAILRQDPALDPVKAEPGTAPPPEEEGRPRREVRKTITVLVADVVETAISARKLDPEARGRLMSRCFGELHTVLDRHGATVEPFVGEAIVGVFGVPVLHEEDALRAVRAAAELQAMLPALSDELEQAWGVRLAARIGISTGEVIAADRTPAQVYGTSESLSSARRLGAMAAPGEILISETTRRLVNGAVRVKAVEATGPFRLVEVLADASALPRRFDSPFVGRERQLASLRAAYTNAVTDRTCHLLTVLGPAGVGKSWLVQELARRLGDGATIVRGRCLSYGEGITYRPVAEVLEQLDGRLLDDPEVAAARSLLGEGQASGSREEIAWAVRRLLEIAASERPLVCIIDDLHWGEETLFDLVEHVADLSRGSPILLLCTARPELLDKRPRWGGGKLNAANLLLEPLEESETELLLDSLGELGEQLRKRVLGAAEGNPLFVEQMVALARESGNGKVLVPPTIQALLAARLDQLEPGERRVLEAGSVEGRTFHRAAVQVLQPAEPQVATRLAALVRKELLRPDRPQLPGDEAYRFRHLLIRDAAYEGLPKVARAELHERFAQWLEEHGATVVELDELLGYHLEQACRYRLEVAQPDAHTGALGAAASERLTVAGRRALGRGDFPAAAALLERAAALLANDAPPRPELLVLLGDALAESGELRRAQAVLREGLEAARAAGARRWELRARIGLLLTDLISSHDKRMVAQAQLEAERATPELERLGDDSALAKAWLLAGHVHLMHSEFSLVIQASERGLAHARAAGDLRAEAEHTFWLLAGLTLGPTPVEQGIARCRQVLAATTTRPVEAAALFQLSLLNAKAGRIDEARRCYSRSLEIHEELGMRVKAGSGAQFCGEIELLAGTPERAEPTLRRAYELLEELGEEAFFSTLAAIFAQVVYEQGRYDEAEALTQASEQAAMPDDVLSQAVWRGVRAKVLARRGETEAAERLGREAIEIAEPGDGLECQATARVDLAEVLELAGRPGEAVPFVEQAAELYERKGNVVMAARARERLARLR